MIWRFKIGGNVVDEPIGWDAVSWTAQRHEHHGILFSSKAESFKWVGDAFDDLEAEYTANGADGAATLTIEYDCDGSGTWSEFFVGEFDFNTYRRICGDMCWIEIALNPANCVNKFLTRINTDVDISSATDLDGNPISQQSFESVELPSQTIVLNNRTSNSSGTDWPAVGVPIPSNGGFTYTYFVPFFPDGTTQEFGNFALYNPDPEIIYTGATPIAWTAADFLAQGQYLMIWQRTTDPLNCIDNDATIDMRIKGTFRVLPTNFDGNIAVSYEIGKYDVDTASYTIIQTAGIVTGPTNIFNGVLYTNSFDLTYFLTPGYEEAEYLLFFITVVVQETVGYGLPASRSYVYDIQWDSESFFNMELQSDCDQTSSLMLQLRSCFSNILQIYIGENCVDAVWDDTGAGCYDNYYLTNGLLLRNVTSPAVPKVFTSFESLFSNITKIFNLGWGFYNSETKFTVSELAFFYSDNFVVDFGSIREVQFQQVSELTYGKINVGYSKWEAEEYTGLDEINTLRTFRRKDSTIANELDLVSNIITAGYTWEITRRKNQAKTGTTDWRYDNDLFLLNTQPLDGTVYAVQGNISSPSNILSPSTRYNFILTPIRNLMRWFKSIAAPTPTLANAEFQFQSGTGNYIAGGEATNTTDCPPEAAAVDENQSIISTDFDSLTAATPLWKTMSAEFDCPMTVSQFLAIKADPYGYCDFSCAGTAYQGYIMELDYRPNEGMATVKLLLKRTMVGESVILMEDAGDVLMEDSGSILTE